MVCLLVFTKETLTTIPRVLDDSLGKFSLSNDFSVLIPGFSRFWFRQSMVYRMVELKIPQVVFRIFPYRIFFEFHPWDFQGLRFDRITPIEPCVFEKAPEGEVDENGEETNSPRGAKQKNPKTVKGRNKRTSSQTTTPPVNCFWVLNLFLAQQVVQLHH